MLHPVWRTEWEVWHVHVVWAISMAVWGLDVKLALVRAVSLSSAHVMCRLSKASSSWLYCRWAWCCKAWHMALHLNVLGMGVGCLDDLFGCDGRSTAKCGSREYLLLRLV